MANQHREGMLRICLITTPLGNFPGGVTQLANFVKILEPLSDDIFIITGNLPENIILKKSIYIKNVKYNYKREFILARILEYILVQLRMTVTLVKISKKIDIVISIAGGALLLPVLTAKLLRKETIFVAWVLYSKSVEEIYRDKLWRGILASLIRILEKIIYTFSDTIVTESESVVSFFGLGKYRDKISPYGALPINTDLFTVQRRYDSRENVVGYIGRLSQEKGIMNFVKAILLISAQKEDVQFIIGGDGDLLPVVKKELTKSHLQNRVTITGWIPHEKVPQYLNELKLFIYPSYTEGLPIAPLEAMACGTPALVTPVGGVPDMIRDGETGFILDNNSPQCITKAVIKALEYPKLGEVAENAVTFVKEQYSYEAAVRHYKNILYGLDNKETSDEARDNCSPEGKAEDRAKFRRA